MKEMQNRTYSCPPLDLLADQAKSGVSLRGMLEEIVQEGSALTLALGRDAFGAPVTLDLAENGHLLIAGSTDVQKRMCIHSVIQSILFRASPRDVKLALIDSSGSIFSAYQGIPHLLAPICHGDCMDAICVLEWAAKEMNRRCDCFMSKRVWSIEEYNAALGGHEEPMRRIVIVIAELSEMVRSDADEATKAIAYLAMKARAVGIHLVAATFHPEMEALPGSVRANFQNKIALRVDKRIDSLCILGETGAENLTGLGDMLVRINNAKKNMHVQGYFASDNAADQEAARVGDWLREHYAPDYSKEAAGQIGALFAYTGEERKRMEEKKSKDVFPLIEKSRDFHDVIQEMKPDEPPTAVVLGREESRKPVVLDMAKMPHVLVAGSPETGTSTCIHTMLRSMILHADPEDVKLILIDPQGKNLLPYEGIAHLMTPVITDLDKAVFALGSWVVLKMEMRYECFRKMNVRNIQEYNAAVGPDEEKMCRIVVIVDELGDLMEFDASKVENAICRVAPLARAAGIHLVIATQKPERNTITGIIKANIPSRIACRVDDKAQSRLILDEPGAEKLESPGDMLLLMSGSSELRHVQSCFVSEDEVILAQRKKAENYFDEAERFLEVIEAAEKSVRGYENRHSDAVAEEEAQTDESVGEKWTLCDDILRDEKLIQAIELAIEDGEVSISRLQRRLYVRWLHAERLIQEMTALGVIAGQESLTKPQKTLITREEWLRMQENWK